LPEAQPPERDTQAARLRSYETLIDVSRMLLGSASLEELFERVTSELRRLVGYDALTIYGVDDMRGMVMPLHSVDMWADEIMASPLCIGEGLTGWAIEHCTAYSLTFVTRYRVDYTIDPGTDVMESATGDAHVPNTDDEDGAVLGEIEVALNQETA